MAKIKLFFVITLFLAVSIQSCKQEEVQVEAKPEINQESFSIHLEEQFNKWTVLVCQDQLPYMDTLQTFYKKRNYKPLWWNAILGDSASWANLSNTFKNSDLHGMDYRYYYLPLVNYYRQQIDRFSTLDSSYRRIAELELIISNSMIKMYQDIANGRTNPNEVYGYTYMLPRNNITKLDFETFLGSSNKVEFINSIHKHDTTYSELLKVMKYYLDKKISLKAKSIDFSEHPKIVIGDSGKIIGNILTRLKARNLPDSKIQDLPDTLVYTKQLQSQIKRLQENYNLTPDGIMGYKTYKVINTTPTDKIDQVKANLERQRWYTKPNKAPFVYVNLPKYEVNLHWKDSVKSMRICIGKNLPDNYDNLVKQYTDSGWLYKLPKNMETPQIASKITYLVINPTWTVPYSIIRNEMWWKLIRNPAYLSAKGFKVFRGKTEVNGDTIQWSKVNKNRIPYTIVESPGPRNSLGTVKYMFNNPFSIYLHDTPSKRAFNRTQRAVSHGCVRLQKPILFGEFLMQNSEEYNTDDFRVMMGYPPKNKARLAKYDPTDTTAAIQKLENTTRVWLKKPMPLYMDYRTVYYDRDWTLHFAYDIYDQNKLILRKMDVM